MSLGKEEIILRVRCLSVLVIKKIDNCSPPSLHFEFSGFFLGNRDVKIKAGAEQ